MTNSSPYSAPCITCGIACPTYLNPEEFHIDARCPDCTARRREACENIREDKEYRHNDTLPRLLMAALESAEVALTLAVDGGLEAPQAAATRAKVLEAIEALHLHGPPGSKRISSLERTPSDSAWGNPYAPVLAFIEENEEGEQRVVDWIREDPPYPGYSAYVSTHLVDTWLERSNRLRHVENGDRRLLELRAIPPTTVPVPDDLGAVEVARIVSARADARVVMVTAPIAGLSAREFEARERNVTRWLRKTFPDDVCFVVAEGWRVEISEIVPPSEDDLEVEEYVVQVEGETLRCGGSHMVIQIGSTYGMAEDERRERLRYELVSNADSPILAQAGLTQEILRTASISLQPGYLNIELKPKRLVARWSDAHLEERDALDVVEEDLQARLRDGARRLDEELLKKEF